jgi:hypothetical protein
MTKGGVTIKYFVSFLLLILLTSCSSDGEPGGKAKLDTKEVTIHIMDNRDDDQRYLVSISTNGKQSKTSAVMPSSVLLVTNNKKVTDQFKLDTKYTIHVSTTDAKNTRDFLNKKKSGHIVNGTLLKNIEFFPTKDKDTLEIKLDY